MHLSKYPSFERRLPREAFTQQLERICQRLTLGATRLVQSRWRYAPSPEGVEVTIQRIWVVGSYARGAITCGDLDLVVETTASSGLPRSAAISKAFFGSPARVRMYTGTPDRNESGVAFPDAVLIWQAGVDWQAAIAGIPPDPAAGRFGRPSDRIPLRAEQVQLDPKMASTLLHQQDSGELTWRFVPLDAVTPVTREDATAQERHLFRIMEDAGRERQKLLPSLLGLMRQEPHADELRWSEQRQGLCFGGTLVMLGEPWWGSLSLAELGTSRVVIAPKLSTRGPNGFWVVERGPQHPLVKKFAGLSLWTLGLPPDGPPVFTMAGARWETRLLDVFYTRDATQELEDMFAADDPEGGVSYEPVEYSGVELLELLSQADGLTGCDQEDIPLTLRGLHQMLENDFITKKWIPSIDELVERLRGQAVAPPIANGPPPGINDFILSGTVTRVVGSCPGRNGRAIELLLQYGPRPEYLAYLRVPAEVVRRHAADLVPGATIDVAGKVQGVLLQFEGVIHNALVAAVIRSSLEGSRVPVPSGQ